MSFISKIFNSGKGDGIVSSIGKVVDNLTTTKAEKRQLDLELKKAEWQHLSDIHSLNNQQESQVLSDKNSARKRAEKVQTSPNATRLNKNISAYLAILTTVLSFALFFVILFYPDSLPQKGKDIIIYILGVLSAIITQVFSFYFGASLKQEESSFTPDKPYPPTIP